MKVTDYLVEFLISKGIDQVFGYPGGVICHFMDSIDKYGSRISGHINYHEQASSFAACGYAQVTGKPGVAYATSGPGATNLVTGISNAYFDSVPTIFITGQVDTFISRGNIPIRQRGFQETDIVAIVKTVTKYATRIDSVEQVEPCLEEAYRLAISGRPGPVLLDIPADIQRAEFSPTRRPGTMAATKYSNPDVAESVDRILQLLADAKRPCLVLGAGVKQSGILGSVRDFVRQTGIPTVASMLAFDCLPTDDRHNFGFIGANGHRYANFILAKSDLVLTLGTRLDLKQVGSRRSLFAPSARIVRVDIDQGELSYGIRPDDVAVQADLKELAPSLLSALPSHYVAPPEWLSVCATIKSALAGVDEKDYHKKIRVLSQLVPTDTVVTVDVGQHQPWVAQAFRVGKSHRFCFSGGLGSMGYSLPAAIGAYYGSRRPVICLNGDGGIQMNIQELQFLYREQLPIMVVIFNNNSLGMIRHFQQMNFASKYIATTDTTGYTVPSFEKLAHAYGIGYCRVEETSDFKKLNTWDETPWIVEVCLESETVLEPKFASGRPNHDQEPFIARDLFEYLMAL